MAKKPEDVKLDSIVDSLFIFLPLFYRKIFQVAHAKAGVTPGNMQFYVLAMIIRMGTLRTSEISCRVGISKPNTTSLLDKLIEQGYARRELDSTDKRIKNIVITEKGRRFVTGRKKIMRNEIRRSLSTLDMNELLTLSGALEAFTDIVSKLDYGS